jgi:hypothetical protein
MKPPRPSDATDTSDSSDSSDLSDSTGLPLLRTWRAVYWFVFGFFILCVVLMRLFQGIFS